MPPYFLEGFSPPPIQAVCPASFLQHRSKIISKCGEYTTVSKSVGEDRERWDAGETRHAHFSAKNNQKLDFLVMTISIS